MQKLLEHAQRLLAIGGRVIQSPFSKLREQFREELVQGHWKIAHADVLESGELVFSCSLESIFLPRTR